MQGHCKLPEMRRDLPRLRVAALSALSDTEATVLYRTFEECGWLVICQQAALSSERISLALADVGRFFGAPIFHKLSDAAGVHPIRGIPGYPQYANTTSAGLLLHTDGSFEVRPPKVMLMYCESPADYGGLSLICQAGDIYAHLEREHPSALAGLFRPDAFVICRDDRRASRAVFTRVGDRIHMTFRYGHDVNLQIHPEAKSGFKAIAAYIGDPANCLEFGLAPGEVLISDNTRVLHGRTAFPQGSQRILHGLWCDGAVPLAFGFVPG